MLCLIVWLSVPVQLIAWKDSSPNDILCVEWDVKPYTLSHSLLFEGLSVLFVSFAGSRCCWWYIDSWCGS